ncbi:MAG: hypothetical protein ACKVQW_10665 [Pyrinomonadaceae bacterium]
MTDGLGTQTYGYNELSQMTAETRQFSDSLPNAPMTNNSFRLEYTYTLASQLKSLKDPYNQQINYDFDKAGRLSSVTGAAYGGVSTYANNAGYRAWGGLKHLEYGNGTQIETAYNNRLQADHFEYTKVGVTTPLLSKNYQYYADGKLKFVDDLALHSIWDRLMTYDHAGRIKHGKSSLEASGGTVANAELSLPYRQSYQFNAFNNLTQRNNLHWGQGSYNNHNFDLNYSYQNDRVTNVGWLHDADGRVTQSNAPDEAEASVYDAAGQLTRIHNVTDSDIYRHQDGLGRETKSVKGTCRPPILHPEDPCVWENEIKYYIRSSVLGGEVVSDVMPDGGKYRTYVHAAGAVIAWQHGITTQSQSVVFLQTDASGMSSKSSTENGVLFTGDGFEGAPTELDPFGSNAGQVSPYYDPYPPEPCGGCGWLGRDDPTRVNGESVEYQIDGMTVNHASFMSFLGMIGGGSVESIILQLTTRLSSQLAGYKISGVRWGTPFTAIYGYDGSQSVTWGAFNPSQSQVSFGNVTPFYSINWSLSVDLISQQQIGTKKPLNEEDQKKYEKKREEIRKRLANISKECLALLTKAGLTVESVIEVVNLQNAYDGSNSTVNTFDAGGIDESGWEPGSREDLRQFERKQSIKDYFAGKDGVQARTMFNPGGKFSDTVLGRSDVYYRTDGNFWNGKKNGFNSQTTILHEALHSLKGLSDEKLYTLLTGKTADHVASSMGISQALRDNGCTK